MERFYTSLKLTGTWVCLIAILTPLAFIANTALAITASIGRPYQGKLKNGVPFPPDFRGYQLRETERTYTTPEVVGALLDAIEGVQEPFPDTCDLYLGDFSLEGGGFFNHHRSHQNGRDVDLGMYAKDNQYLDRFIPMNETNLDVPKTWQLVENLLQTQKIQYVFVDKSIQQLLYDYALSRGQSRAYLDQLFGNVRGAIIQHVRGHKDHMHVRFYTPWSSLAGQLNGTDNQQQQVIEMAQQAFLPKKVRYYVKGDDSNLRSLAQSFGVTSKDLCRWNRLRGNDVPTPGTCLVFYKRGFEIEPVHLARTLQPNPALDLDPSPIRLASLPSDTLRDIPSPKYIENKSSSRKSVKTLTCKVQKGDTLDKIAKRNGVTVEVVCKLNGLRKGSTIKCGQVLKIGQQEVPASGAEQIAASLPTKNRANTGRAQKTANYTVRSGDTLWRVAAGNGMDVATLCKLNGIRKDTVLSPGQELKIVAARQPVTGSKQASVSVAKKGPSATATKKQSSPVAAKKESSTTAARKESAAATAKKQPPATATKGASAGKSKSSAKTHTIKNGENLSAIAKKYGTSAQVICQLNGLSNKATLQPGAKIRLP